MLLDILGVVFGLVLIIKGADTMVEGSSDLARKFRISEAVIGLTVVAFGTSLPEFVVSFFSALKGSGDMSVGNIMGSNIFNSLVILGASSLVSAIPVGRRALKIDIPLSFVAALVCCLLCFDTYVWHKSQNTLSRYDALIFCFCFALFMYYNYRLAKRDKEGMRVEEVKDSTWLILFKLVVDESSSIPRRTSPMSLASAKPSLVLPSWQVAPLLLSWQPVWLQPSKVVTIWLWEMLSAATSSMSSSSLVQQVSSVPCRSMAFNLSTS